MTEFKCSGCGMLFGRNDEGMLVHPEPWCLAMVSGEEDPRTVVPMEARRA